jgi:hypothetical protein
MIRVFSLLLSILASTRMPGEFWTMACSRLVSCRRPELELDSSFAWLGRCFPLGRASRWVRVRSGEEAYCYAWVSLLDQRR